MVSKQQNMLEPIAEVQAVGDPEENMMNNSRVISSAFLVIGLAIAAFAFKTTNHSEKAILATDKNNPPIANTINGNAGSPQEIQAPAQTKANSYDGPSVQYVGSNEKYDHSLLGENARIYSAYDNSTLETLADGGDLLAAKVLANRLITNPPIDSLNDEPEENIKRWEEYLQKKKKYIEMSLIYGDMELVKSAAHLSMGGFDPRDHAQVRDAVLEELAFLEFAALRGLQTKKYQDAPRVLNRYSGMLHKPLILSQEDKSHILERAQEIYDDLEAKRKAMNLGPFEEIEDKKHNKFFPEYDPAKDYLDAMGENAF
jgi:hypothetical protein